MIDKGKLNDALRKMGSENVKEQYRRDWSPERPTTGFCYVVAEVVFHYCAPNGSQSYRMETGPTTSHWFIKTPDGTIIDLTADQFDKALDYTKGVATQFRTQHPSKRAQILAELLGLSKPDGA